MPPSECSDITRLHLASKINLKRSPVPHLILFDSPCKARDPMQGHILLLYSCLTNKNLNITWDLPNWQDIAGNLSKISINMALVESNYKTIMRWHRVPPDQQRWIHRLHPRNCGQTDTLIYIWWQCPEVMRVWIRIFSTWSIRFTDVNISRSPDCFLSKIGYWNPKRQTI